MAEHICPWWIGYLLVNPLRRFGQNPIKILSPFIQTGMTVLDVGCGMGFFSLDMARLTGKDGTVICVDLQEKMIKTLMKRAAKSGLQDRIDYRVCSTESLNLNDLDNTIDFSLAFAIVHEIPNAEHFFKQIFQAIKPNGSLLFSEPKGHVSEKNFQRSLDVAEGVGFQPVKKLTIMRSHSMLLKK